MGLADCVHYLKLSIRIVIFLLTKHIKRRKCMVKVTQVVPCFRSWFGDGIRESKVRQ